MLKEAVASKAAKLLMTCVCPVAGTTALTLGVPQARDAVHKAVQPRQYAKPKTRTRLQAQENTEVASAEECPTVAPMAMSDMPLTTPNASATSVASKMSGTDDSHAHLAEVPTLEGGEALMPRIFIPRRDVVTPSNKGEGREMTAWVELFLGAG